MVDNLASASAGEELPRRAPHRRWLWCVLPLLALAGLTLLVRIGDWDMAAQRLIFEAGDGSWALGDLWFWRGVYDYGVYPAAAVMLAATLGLLPGLGPRSILRWRRICVFLILLGVLAPGLITNGLLKEYWGRPRPREVVEFGGNVPFEPVLTMDRSTKGYSFPSGHATMGFYFMGLFPLLHLYRRKLAWGFLVFGFALGSVLGAARMLQGGHFLSDVAWAAAVCWFTGLGLFYALGFHRSEEKRMRHAWSVPPWATVLGAACGLGMVVGTLLATPYRERDAVLFSSESLARGAVEIEATLSEGDFLVRSGHEFEISSSASGHGMPTSRIVPWSLATEIEGGLIIVYFERLSGWFSELSRQGEIMVPWERVARFELNAGTATLRLLADASWSGRALVLKGGEEEVVIDMADGSEVAYRIVAEAEHGGTEAFDGFTLVLAEGFLGEVRSERAAPPEGDAR